MAPPSSAGYPETDDLISDMNEQSLNNGFDGAEPEQSFGQIDSLSEFMDQQRPGLDIEQDDIAQMAELS